MAYSKRWTIPFKSYDGKDCRVDIYKEGYTGATVDTLTGAPNPFNVSGQTDDDLFKPIRLQSGYIRIICGDDSWRELIPKYNKSHKVLFYYNNILVWQGYMKAEMYEHSLYNLVDEYDFPVICPLTILEQAYLDDKTETINTSTSTFHALLSEILSKIGYDCSVAFTKITQDNDFIISKINRMLYFDDNDEYHISQNKKIFKSSKSCMEILSDYCTFWGFTCEMHRSQITFGAPDLIDSADVPIIFYSDILDLKDNVSSTKSGQARTISEPIVDNSAKEKIIPPRASVVVKADCAKNDIDISIPNMEDCLRIGYQTLPLLKKSTPTDTEGKFTISVERRLNVTYTTTGVPYEQKYDYEFPNAHYTFYDYDYPNS